MRSGGHYLSRVGVLSALALDHFAVCHHPAEANFNNAVLEIGGRRDLRWFPIAISFACLSISKIFLRASAFPSSLGV